jgi:hypothetical protein
MAPQPKPQYRTWCKNCKKFEIHVWHSETDLVCKICDLIYTPYKTSEIPENLLLEQRQRYKNQKYNKIDSYLNLLKPSNIIFDMLQTMDEAYSIITIECDAGLKAINENRIKRINIEKQRIADLNKDFDDNYSKLNRNDKCSCGSGKKYKVCHLKILREQGLKI